MPSDRTLTDTPNHHAMRPFFWMLIGLVSFLSTTLSGCTLIEKAAELPMIAIRVVARGFEPDKTYDPVDLQENILRFADNFIISMSVATESLKRNGEPVSREFLVMAKLKIATDIITLATGSNPLANLVSMIVFTESVKTSIREYWRPMEFGDSVDRLEKVVSDANQDIRALGVTILAQDQMNELSNAVQSWHKLNPQKERGFAELANITLVNQILEKGDQSKQIDTTHSSVFSLLDLDPLASLDPATRELSETRLFGERALFMGKRVPQLMEWQMELLTARTGRVPEVKHFVESAQEIAKASAKVGKTAEMLPSVISSEREKILAALTKEQGEMGHLAQNFGEAFGEGSKMADATSAMLKTYESVLQEIRKTPPNGHEDDPPFRIKDYEESAAKIEKMAERLTVLIQTIEPLLAPQNTGRLTLIIDRAIEQAETRSRSLIHHTFWQGLLFILLGSLIIAVVFLFTTRVYRRQLSASNRHQ